MSHIGILSFVIFMFLLSQTIKIMNKRSYIFLSLLLAMSACDNSITMDSESNIMTRSVIKDFTYFNNIETITSETGDCWISGDIYCSREATYTFIFSGEATGNVGYEPSIVTSPMLRPDNGSNFRTITRVLKPGINHCYVHLLFTGPDQQGYARLIITQINNNPLSSEYTGESVDLVASGYSNLQDTSGGTIPGHWHCPSCGILNSWSDKCPICGTENSKYDGN